MLLPTRSKYCISKCGVALNFRKVSFTQAANAKALRFCLYSSEEIPNCSSTGIRLGCIEVEAVAAERVKLSCGAPVNVQRDVDATPMLASVQPNAGRSSSPK